MFSVSLGRATVFTLGRKSTAGGTLVVEWLCRRVSVVGVFVCVSAFVCVSVCAHVPISTVYYNHKT